MPESFDSMLSELADAAVAVTGLPDIAAIRRRARQRAVRHRIAASALAVVLIGATGGTVAAVAAHRGRSSANAAAAASPGTTASVLSDTPSPSLLGTPGPTPTLTLAASSAASSATSSASAVRAPTIGLWKRSDTTTGYLVIYGPDGTNGQNAVIGITEAGSLDLCYGIIEPLNAKAVYPITGVQCGGNLAPDMQLGFDKGTGFVLYVPTTKTAPAYTIPYQNDDVDLGSVSVDATAQTAAGTWVDSAGLKFTISANGTATWAGLSHSADQSGTGTVRAELSGLRVLVPCSTGTGDCGVFQLVFNSGLTQMTVIGSYGPDQFQRATPATTSTSATP